MISVIILTKNEESQIVACLQSVMWADEIIVVDDHSTDKTAILAKASGALVYYHDLKEDFAAQRNFALQKAHGEWIVFLDADERVSDDLKKEILHVTASLRNRYSGYTIRRTDFFLGRELKYGETGTANFLRLARKGSGKWVGSVHETWEINGHIKQLTSPLLHFPHPTIANFLGEINFYTTLRANELYRRKVQASFLSILLHTKGKFFQNYFIKLGILDGIPGLVSALMMSFHAFLVRSKLWLLWQTKKKTA